MQTDILVQSLSGSSGLKEDTSHQHYPLQIHNNLYLAYAPSNAITDELMESVKVCFWGRQLSVVELNEMFSKQKSDSDIEDWLKTRSVNGKDAIALMFEETDKLKALFKYLHN